MSPTRKAAPGVPRGRRTSGIVAPVEALLPMVRGAAGVVVVVLAALHMHYLAFVCDDAFISFRYAHNLVAGSGLVFNPGERVEGYTNFLWVMVSALVIQLGGAPEVWAPLIGAACALTTLIVLMVVLEHRTPWCGVVGGALLAANASFAAWATGGLETALFGLLATLAFLTTLQSFERHASRALMFNAVLLGLAAMTRPDGVIFAAATGAILAVEVARRRLPLRRLLRWTAMFAVIYGGYFAWRASYYGHLLPNTVAVKTGGGSLLSVGLLYLGLAASRMHFELALVAGPVLLALREPTGVSRRELGLWAALVLPFLTYLAQIGGDFMDLFRFLAPMMPFLAWLSAIWMVTLAAALAGRYTRGAAVGATLLLLGAWSAINLRASVETVRVGNFKGLDSIGLMRKYTADWTRVGRFFAATAQPTDSLATTAAGIVPYYSRLYTIDQLGLVAPDLSRYRRLPARRPGHDLVITGRALIELRPQYILGHPRVVDQERQLRSDVSVEPGWGSKLGQYYRPAVVRISQDPPRYLAILLRRDLVATPR